MSTYTEERRRKAVRWDRMLKFVLGPLLIFAGVVYIGGFLLLLFTE